MDARRHPNKQREKISNRCYLMKEKITNRKLTKKTKGATMIPAKRKFYLALRLLFRYLPLAIVGLVKVFLLRISIQCLLMRTILLVTVTTTQPTIVKMEVIFHLSVSPYPPALLIVLPKLQHNNKSFSKY